MTHDLIRSIKLVSEDCSAIKPTSTAPYIPKAKPRFSWILRLAGKMIKYYLLSLFGFVMACFVAAIFGGYWMLEPLLLVIWDWFIKFAALTLCFIAVAIVVESLRQ